MQLSRSNSNTLKFEVYEWRNKGFSVSVYSLFDPESLEFDRAALRTRPFIYKGLVLHQQ